MNARLLFVLAGTIVSLVGAEKRDQEFALILEDEPVAQRFAVRSTTTRTAPAAAESHRQIIRAKQAGIKRQLSQRNIRITGSTDTLVNAIFVKTAIANISNLRTLDGVKAVALLPRIHRNLDRALDLVNARAAWNAIGGVDRSGLGVKIAVIDSGIDQTHTGLQDPSLSLPSGFPRGDSNFTNTKVIVARSYVSQLSTMDPALSTPDDNSPRDRVGHGTAMAMIAAGATNTGPVAAITGVAPKAWLGNYKIFGSPGINNETTLGVLIQALEDALNDGMDIALLGLGYSAVYGPLDESSSCQPGSYRSYIPTDACDVQAQAVEHAVLAGMTVVVSAGNDGASGSSYPTLGTINSPGTAPSAITVGATTNSHILYAHVSLNGGPPATQNINALYGDGPKLNSDLTAAITDVTALGNDGSACDPLPGGSLTGKIAFVVRGTCDFYVKVDNASVAGAVAVLMYDPSSDNIFTPTYLLNETAIPLAFIGVSSGSAIKNALRSNSSLTATLGVSLTATDAPFDTISATSSRGPAIGSMAIKPEIAAAGTDLYTATQNYDPNGDTYNISRYASVEGTSFAAAMVAGAAALVKQVHPSFAPVQIKSAIVNTATAGVIMDNSVPARVTAIGAGKLNVAGAVTTNVTLSPSSISFGQIGNSLPSPISVTITNTGQSSLSLSLSISQRDPDSNATLSVNPSSVTLAPGQQTTIAVQLTGRVPSPGSYEGQINFSGASTPLHIPYLYLTGNNRPANIFPVFGDNYIGYVTEYQELVGFRLIDQSGAPVVNQAVQWSTVSGDGSIDYNTGVDTVTDRYGIAAAYVAIGQTPGWNIFEGDAGGLRWQFYQLGVYQSSISTNGVVNAASFQAGSSLAPGSYAAIFGNDLAPAFIAYRTPYLPISLGDVSVSFDIPSAGISIPAPLHFISQNQVNIQIPWEISGQSSATMKIIYSGLPSQTYTLALNPYSPAFFEFDDSTNGSHAAAATDVNGQVITGARPAIRGQGAVLYANGLGPVTNQPPSGVAAQASPLSLTPSQPVVTIAGQQAQVTFSGLAPGYVGLYQINVVVPEAVPSGLQPLNISMNGMAGKTSQIAIQ